MRPALAEARQVDRPADGEAVFLLPILRARLPDDPVEVGSGVEGFVAHEKIAFAMKVVRACFDREIDDAARRVAVLGGILAGRDGELLEGVGPRRDLRKEGAVFASARRHAVNQNIRAATLSAVDAEVEGAGSRDAA